MFIIYIKNGGSQFKLITTGLTHSFNNIKIVLIKNMIISKTKH